MKKYSRKREAILNAIRSTASHPSAEWVYNRLKPDFPDLSLATVYRNIAEFLEEGEIVSVGNVCGQERYDGTTSPHAHFICDSCGSVIDIDCSLHDPGLDSRAAASINAEVTRHEIYFRGRCNSCMAMSR